MSQIQIEFDNKLEKSEIVIPLLNSSKENTGTEVDESNLTDKEQLKVFGIQVPIIMINHTVIDFDAVKYFDLKSEGKLPELIMMVEDRYELINNVDKPGLDNEVRIQILPKFDNTYKKINLTFYISKINVNGSIIKLTCTYKLNKLVSSKFESFGEIDTYNIFKNAALDTGLGFASNTKENELDKRFVYCDNKSWMNLLDEEIQFADSSNVILDWWIDLWDNINLVDIKERYLTIDSDNDIAIWISGQVNDVNKDVDLKPIKVPAIINNHPANNNSELFVKNYSIDTSPGSYMSYGSDKVYGIYEDIKNEYIDHLIQDGDIKSDIFTKYEYLGESYGDYNYLLSKYIRSGYLQKISSEKIKCTLNSAVIGLMRGHKVNFIRYVNDDKVENKLKRLEESEIIDRNIESNIPLNDYEITNDGGNGKFILDKTASGQYLITAVEFLYNNNEWNYILTLVKPGKDKVSILKSN